MAGTEPTLVQTTAQTLSSLPTDQLVILFTPAIPSTDGYEDPFETLGRSLSKWHARVDMCHSSQKWV
ncbi:hypothetical protein D6D08_10034 [Aureobasidium pullulans]|nr:hypothetical protein D6D08_10034 [Aureobasidium pullulans]